MEPSHAQIAYRRDIDGLRAVAVLPVVLYHAGVEALSGGYVGVDVFFVISGFLIASIIAREIDKGRFSLVNFYERRARRILPALFAVIGTTLIAAWVTAWPEEFAGIGQSAIATVFFGSNVYFWQSTDYFATAAEYLPLLHTWSLAVEEQFYIVFPLLLMAMAGRARVWLVSLCAGLFVLSVVSSFIATADNPVAAFFLSPMRAWELLLGVFLALNIAPAWSSRALREFAAIAGLALILFAVIAFERMTSLIPLAMAVPCIGAMLVIQSGRGDGPPTVVARLLSNGVLVFVGLISYSLYLWHWPILAFSRSWLETTHLPAAWAFWCVIASLVIAAVSWRYVERPFRQPATVSRAAVFRFAGVGAVALAGVASVILAGNGFPGRIPAAAFDALAGARDMEENRHRCMGRKDDGEYCIIGTPGAEPSALLLGDSHAAALMSAVGVALDAQARSAYLASYSACPPLLGIQHMGGDDRAGCDEFVDSMVEFVATRSDTIDLVVLAARWPVYVTGQTAPGESPSPFRMATVEGDNGLSNPELVELGLSGLVRRFADEGVRIVILGGVPEVGWNVPRTIARAQKLGTRPPELPTLSAFAERHASANRILRDVSRSNHVAFVPLAPLLCDPVCNVLDETRPIYIDDDHLSAYGARSVLGPKLAIEFSGALVSQSF
jgi:peptidoglycan/LPS O-acetylase OafA/YrhL